MKFLSFIILALVGVIYSQAAAPAEAADIAAGAPQSVGLVLSGGGAKGIAHIGVIQALEDNNIPIDYITGTSMGAIVGGLYACGYTPAEMMDLILSRGFSYWSTGQIDPKLVYYFTKAPAEPVALSLPIKSRRDSIEAARAAVPASLISPLPMSFAFMELFSPYTAQCDGDFNRLFVPFRCVATDAAAKHKVVLGSGDLGDAIRASMSFPIVFQPTRVDSMLLYDGGIYDNFPVGVMTKDFAPDIMIGVDVSASSTGPQTSLMDQIDNLVIQSSDYSLPAALGIKIRVNLNQFALLDFPKAKQIYQIGYDKAMEMIDSIKGRVSSRIAPLARQQRREAFKASTPYVRFDSVHVHGASPAQDAYIKYIFTGRDSRPDTLSMDQARTAFYRAISPGRLRDLTPHAAGLPDSAGLFTLDLRASVKDNMRVGFGGYVTSSAASFLYLSAGYSRMSFSSAGAAAGVWIGQSYMGGRLTGNLYLRTSTPSVLELEAVAYRHKFFNDDVLFFDDALPSSVIDHEYYGRLKWAVAIASRGKLDLGLGVGHINDSYYALNVVAPAATATVSRDTRRDHNRLTLGQAFARYTEGDLDNINFPTMGHSIDLCAMAVAGRAREEYGNAPADGWSGTQTWLQLGAKTRSYISPSRHFSLGLESEALLSTRKLLPGYNASLIAAPAFMPTPAAHNYYNPAFQANSYLAAGVVPVYKHNSSLSARLSLYGFVPLRKILNDGTGHAIYSSHWLSHPEFFGEAEVCYSFPFATLTAYCNYTSSPARNWNCGVSFGIFLLAPKFLR